MNYQIVEASSAEKLVDKVNELIKGGWEPLGGVSVMFGNGWKEYAQALAKPKPTSLLAPVAPAPLATPLAG